MQYLPFYDWLISLRVMTSTWIKLEVITLSDFNTFYNDP